MQITRKFIADKAKVSPTTVSDVLNNNPKARIGEATKKRVIAIAKKYNYFPNILARSLVMKKTFNIGFISTQPIVTFLTYPFNNPIFLGLEKEIEDNGYSLVFSLLKSKEEINFAVRKMIMGNIVDGIILSGRVEENLINLIKQNNIDFVIIDYFLNSIETNAIMPDNIDGAYEATKYLIDQNCNNIYCINGNEDHPAYKERPAGYKKAMNEAKLKTKFIISGTTIDDAYQVVTNYIKKENLPDAFFACGDPMAIGTLRALKDAKIKIPKQVKVIGFDNIYLAELESPKLTTMNVQKSEMGQEAVKLLLSNIKNNEKPQIRRLPTTLIKRETA